MTNKLIIFSVLTVCLAFLISSAVWIGPISTALYYQIRGGIILARVQQENGMSDADFACENKQLINNRLKEDVDRAKEYLQRAMSYYPKLSKAYLLMGRALCLSADPKAAVNYFATYNKLRPNNPLGFLEMGFAYEAIDDHNLANKAWYVASVTGDDFLSVAGSERQAKHYEAAIAWYDRAAIMGASIETQVSYTNYLDYLEKGDTVAASRELASAIAIDQGWLNAGDRFQAWFQWGKWLVEQGRNSEAEAALATTIAINPVGTQYRPMLSEAYRLLGLSQWEQKNLKDAAINFETAIKINPSNAWAHENYGKVIYFTDRNLIGKTMDEFNNAIGLQPQNVGLWVNLIDFWRWVGEKQYTEVFCEKMQKQFGEIQQQASRCSNK